MLNGIQVAALVADGFEEVELTGPASFLKKQGAQVWIVSPNRNGWVRSWKNNEWGSYFPVDFCIDQVDPTIFDVYLQPGGVMNPDKLRINSASVDFARNFFLSGKACLLICHGVWLLAEAGCARGHVVTSWPSLKTDLSNAGAHWVNEPVVKSGNIITSRFPGDIPFFNEASLDLILESIHS
jgi:protease I